MNLYLTKIVRGGKSLFSIIKFLLMDLAARFVTVFSGQKKVITAAGSATSNKELAFLGEVSESIFSEAGDWCNALNQILCASDAIFCYVPGKNFLQNGNIYNVANLDETIIQTSDCRLGVAFYDLGLIESKDYDTFTVLKKLHRLKHGKVDFTIAYVVDSRGNNGKLDRIKKSIGLLGFDVVIGAEEKIKGKQNFRTNKFGETRICYSLGRFLQKDRAIVASKAGVAYKLKLYKDSKRIAVEKEGYLPLHIRSSRHEVESVSLVEKGQRFYLHIEKLMKGFRNWNDLIYMQDILDVIGCSLPKEYAYLCNFAVNQICARTYELAPGNIFIFRQAIIDKNDKKVESEFWRNRLIVRAFTRKSMFIFSYKPLLPFVPHMVIEDPLEAHISLMAWYREKYIPAKYIGITGSIGKTSTKDMLYYVLQEKYRTERSKRNNNVQVKIALGMVNIASNCEAFVQEIGGGRKYGASRHSRMILPDATIVTNIGTAHLGNYESQQELMEHKLMITDGMKENGVLFLNGDDPLLWTAEPNAKTVFFAVNNHQADYYADHVRADDGVTYFDIVHGQHRVAAQINVLGEYNVLNAVCAYAVAKHLDMTDDEIVRGMLNFRTTGIRQNLISVGGYRFFVDCYNASVASIGSSLSVLRQLKPQEGGKRIAVVGDVTGVGEFQEEIDKEIAKIINDYGDIDCVVCFGVRASYISQFLNREGKETICIETAEEFKHWMTEIVKPQDVVMLKGSSKLKMDEKLDDYFGLNLSDQRYIDSSHYVLHRENEIAYRIFADYVSLSKYHGADATVHIEDQVMGKRVKKITDFAFSNCEYIQEVRGGNQVLHIGRRAFANCKNLRSIICADSVKYIEEGAFDNCRNLENIVLGKGVLHIGEHAFRNCKKLKVIELPKRIGYIADNAFDGCVAEIKYVE